MLSYRQWWLRFKINQVSGELLLSWRLGGLSYLEGNQWRINASTRRRIHQRPIYANSGKSLTWKLAAEVSLLLVPWSGIRLGSSRRTSKLLLEYNFSGEQKNRDNGARARSRLGGMSSLAWRTAHGGSILIWSLRNSRILQSMLGSGY